MKNICRVLLCILLIISNCTFVLAETIVDQSEIGCKVIVKDEITQIAVNASPPLNTGWILSKKIDLEFIAPVDGFYRFNHKIKNLDTGIELEHMDTTIKFCHMGRNYFTDFSSIVIGYVNFIASKEEYVNRVRVIKSVEKITVR